MTDSTSPRERLDRVLQRKPVDRPPVAFVGGMMNAALVDVMKDTGNPLPEAYDDADRLSKLALDVTCQTGFENLALPFCMTLEAELLGSEIDKGTLTCEAKITKEAFPSVKSAVVPHISRLPEGGRAERVVRAIERTALRRPEEPLFGSLTGPVSTAASIVDPIAFLKDLRKDRENCHRVLSEVTDTIYLLAATMVEAGAEVIAISDPTATGEILGPKAFEDYALRHLNLLVERLHALQVKVIVHICGDVTPVEHLVAKLQCDAISTDAQVNLARLKGKYPHLVTMGNVSTSTLQFGDPDRISQRTRRLVADGVDIIAPACGLGTTTPLANVLAMTHAVKES